MTTTSWTISVATALRPLDAAQWGALLVELQRQYPHCRRFILSTDGENTPDGAASHSFYRSTGMAPLPEAGTASFIRW